MTGESVTSPYARAYRESSGLTCHARHSRHGGGEVTRAGLARFESTTLRMIRPVSAADPVPQRAEQRRKSG